MSSEEVEFDPWGPKTIERGWTFNLNLPRRMVPDFCAALEDVMKIHRGGVFYFPRVEDDCTRCRYDWFLRCGREAYGFRLTLVFDTRSKDVNEIKVYLSLGPRTNKSDIDITREIERRILRSIKQILNEAREIIEGKVDSFYPVFYIKLPPGEWISADVNAENGTVYRSANNLQIGEVISAIAPRTFAYVKGVARERALPAVDKLTALMSLLADAPLVVAHPKLPRRGSFHTVRKEPPSISKIYPASYHVWEALSHTGDLKQIALLSLQMAADKTLMGDDKLWQSIYAYSTGQTVQKEHPTLASVAYIASLSTFVETKMCHGTVSCSVCGVRPSHPLESESDGIAELAIVDLGLQSDSVNKERVRNLVKAVYSKQRSAYVHDAVLRHQEVSNSRAQVGRPAQQSPISEELEFLEQLNGIRRLARRVLLLRLPKNDSLRSLIEDSSTLSILPTVPMVASIVIGRRPVGFKVHP